MDSAARLRIAGLVGGMTLGYVAVQIGLGMLAPPIFVACICVGVLAAEVTLPRPERSVPVTAALEVRRMRDYVPRAAARGVVAMGLAVLAGIIVTALVDRFGSGWMPSVFNQIRYFGAYGLFGGFDHPPVWGYDQGGVHLSAVVTLGVTVVLAVVVLHLLVRSPRSGVDAHQRSRDEAWRRRTAAMITAAVGVILSLPLAALSLAAAWALSDGGFVELLGATVLAALGAVALVAFAGYTSMLMRPASSWEAQPGDGSTRVAELTRKSS